MSCEIGCECIVDLSRRSQTISGHLDNYEGWLAIQTCCDGISNHLLLQLIIFPLCSNLCELSITMKKGYVLCQTPDRKSVV